jgi:hypothetical protein
MSPTRLATLGLAAAILFAATPAFAGNRNATRAPVNTQEIERLGPKYLLRPTSPQVRTLSVTLTRQTIPTRVVEELGPKYLLGFELKAAQSQPKQFG